MNLNQLNTIIRKNNVNIIFTDYYDTIVHRTVHPNYVMRLWAKMVINELGLNTSIDYLYFTRQESVKYLMHKFSCEDVELPYNTLKAEVKKRLINAGILNEINKEHFLDLFELADIRSESSVQFLNDKTVAFLKDFKDKGGKVYLVSDFYGPTSMFEALLDYHNIRSIFDGIYSSSAVKRSKYKGSIFSYLISELNLNANEILMMGDNKVSDVKRAKENGLHAYLMPHSSHLKRNKRNNFGNDYKEFKQELNKIYRQCNKNKAQPFSEYIIFYHLFTERLYKRCKQKGVKNIFFLSREGQFLKKLFDSYQEYSNLSEPNKIESHYLRISRQASIQISLKPIEIEQFDYLKKNHNTLSIKDFLGFFSFSEKDKSSILSQLNNNSDENIVDFFNSEVFKELKLNPEFIKHYNYHRKQQYDAFVAYINSFNVDTASEGIYLVDIGWGGTMQESIYKFFEEKIKVTGFYVGLREIYNITEDTPREGLLFSVLPFESYDDSIIMTNTQLYEQFAAANHGSALGYSKSAENYTLQFHEPNEKWLYDNYIKNHQEFSFSIHKQLLNSLSTICYDDIMVQKQITHYALKIGLFQSRTKIKYLEALSKGFYQNIGDNKVGLTYDLPESKGLFTELKHFLLKPEHYFRYMVKLKPYIYGKNRLLAYLFPSYPIYWYYRLNKYIRFNILNRVLVLKYNFMKR